MTKVINVFIKVIKIVKASGINWRGGHQVEGGL